MPKYRRFTDASVSEKILDTMFLIAMGLGYLFAMLHTFFTHQGHDGHPGLSVHDIRIAYYGEHEQTRLGAMLNGAMGVNLRSPEQKAVILNWIDKGTPKKDFDAKILPILQQNCLVCHSRTSGMGLTPLETYEDVTKLTVTDTGASIQSLVRVSHIHMFGIAFILFLVGRIFILCELPVMLKRVMVVIPFAAVLVDIMSWYLTKLMPGFAFVVYGAGVLMGLSFVSQIFISIYQMWIYKPKVIPVEM